MKKIKILVKILDFKYSVIIGLLFGIIMLWLELPRTLFVSVYAVIYFFVYMSLYMHLIMLIDKKQQSAIEELDHKCEPYNFLEIINDMAEVINNPNIKQSLLLNKTAGLNATGNFDDAISLLKEININKLNSTFKALYYNNMASCYIEKLELQNAEDNLNQLLKLINDKSINKRYIEELETCYKINFIYLNMYNNNFDNCVDGLEDICLRTKNLRLKVICNYGIGYCYYMNNNKLKSKEYFDYVITNGNRLYTVRKAQKHIEEMN